MRGDAAIFSLYTEWQDVSFTVLESTREVLEERMDHEFIIAHDGCNVPFGYLSEGVT